MKQHHISLLLIWRSIPKIILILSNFGCQNDHMLVLCSWLCMVTVVDDVSTHTSRFGHRLQSVYGTTCQMQRSHPAFPPCCPGRRLGAPSANILLFTRARRSRFPHTQPTMLLLHLPPTILPPVRSACRALKKSFHTLPCFWIAWLTRSQNTSLPLFGLARSWTVRVRSLFIYYTRVFIVL